MVCVGIDVSKDKHDCCILDSEGTKCQLLLYYITYNYDKLVYKNLETKYGKNTLDDVITLQNNGIDYEHSPNSPRLTDHQINAWCALDNAVDCCYENDKVQ